MTSSNESIKNIQKNLRQRRLAEIRVRANSILEPIKANLDELTLTHLWIALTCDYILILLPQAKNILARMVVDLVDADLLTDQPHPIKEEENGVASKSNERAVINKEPDISNFELVD